jgi:hypothetical protein
LDKKDKVVPPTATTDLKSDSRRLEEQPYGGKLSKYSNRSQGKIQKKLKKLFLQKLNTLKNMV